MNGIVNNNKEIAISSRGGVITINNLYFIKREKDNVVVSIMFCKADKKYHFVNLTKDHICSCAFDKIDDAILDMEHFKNNGKLIEYYKITI